MSGQPLPSAGYRERNSTADRALDILNSFTEDRPVLSGFELAERLGVARSTAYRYLQSLVGSHFLEEAPDGGFRLGLRVLELARVARRNYGLSEVALPIMQDLAREVDEAVLLTRRTANLVVCVDRAEVHTGPVRISYERGSTLAINAGAAAQVLLAWTPAEQVRTLLGGTELHRFTPQTVVDVDALMARLERINRDGYAITRSELDMDILGIAAPIWDDRGQVRAAVSVAALASRVPKKAERGIAKQVQRAAGEITERLALVDG